MIRPVPTLPAWVRRLSPTAVRALVIPAGVGLLALMGGLVGGADAHLYDGALRWRALGQPSEPKPYVLVEIDDRSVAALGRFPWSRAAFAELLARTREGGASVVALDVIFSEPADSAGDAALARALRSAGNVVLASVPVLAPEGGEGLPVAERVVEPIPELARAAAGVGSISILEDADGAMRRYSLVVRHRGEPYPSLAQLVAGIAARDGEGSAAVRGDGTMLINYGALSPEAIGRVSFSEVLRYGPEQAREVFRDRIVMVAATYTGGVDYGPTPLSPRSPRAFAQIYAVHTLLAGRQLRELPALVPFLLALVAAGLLARQIPARHPVQLLGMGAALVAVLLAGSALLFLAGGVVVGPALPVLATAVVVSGYGMEQWWTSNLHLRKRNQELVDTLESLRRTRSAKERMEAELNIAREIQFSMLPLGFPAFPEREEFELHATLVPAREVGGDFYDFFLVDRDHLCVAVGDVSGKGVPAALFMAVAKAILKSNAGRERSPAAILTRANAELAVDNEASMFVSVWLALLDLATGEVVYANAGHNPPYLRRCGGELLRLDARHGPVVAAVEGVTFTEERAVLAPGDTLLLYTDGVPEARDPEGTLYEEERLRHTICASRWESPRELVEAAADDVWRFQGDAPQADDLTLLALRYRGRSGGSSALPLPSGAGVYNAGTGAPDAEAGAVARRPPP